jgi:hypothetical protein
METDRDEYDRLQILVRKDIRENYRDEIHPVQYDDLAFRRLNRAASE